MPNQPQAEGTFKDLVRSLIADGIYPGAVAINRARDKYWELKRNHSLNGRECRWIREVWDETPDTDPMKIERQARAAREGEA